jgi:hypothetical protein
MTAAQKPLAIDANQLRVILDNHPEIRDEVERAYRRGYAQAAFIATEQLRDGYTLADLVRWHKGIDKWRYNQGRDHRGYKCARCWTLPPDLPEMAKRGGR